jgi:prepilin-type N-terminal cleavage/methylation domain-containing protein
VRRKDRGFTLIELLVVIFIISILAIFILVITANSRARARDKKRQTDITALATAFESYFANTKSYPVPSGVPDADGYIIGDSGIFTNIKNYISEIPKDPNQGDDAGGGITYGYHYNSVACGSYQSGQKYYVNAIVENKESSNNNGQKGRKDSNNYYYELGSICFQRNSGDCQCLAP